MEKPNHVVQDTGTDDLKLAPASLLLLKPS